MVGWFTIVTTMEWRNVLGVRSKTLPIWAALCIGRADGSDQILGAGEARNPRYGACARIGRRKRHLFAGQSTGWCEPTIQKLKKLVQPFHSDDPIMRDCYERATKSGDGIVIYSDPIEEA